MRHPRPRRLVLAAAILMARRSSRSRSGTPSRSGLGTSSSTTAPSAGTTSWTCASTARPTRRLQRVRSVRLLGVFAITHSTSTASPAGSRRARSARSTTVTGNSRSMVAEGNEAKGEAWDTERWGILLLAYRRRWDTSQEHLHGAEGALTIRRDMI